MFLRLCGVRLSLTKENAPKFSYNASKTFAKRQNYPTPYIQERLKKHKLNCPVQ